MIITVFGGSRPDEETRRLAYELGAVIAIRRHVLKNGGYDGTMEEAARGYKEAGGERVIGVCLRNSNIPSMQIPNMYCTEKIYVDTLAERKIELINTDRVVALPGQMGTVDELISAWNDASQRNNSAVYLLGERNRKLLEFLVQNGFVKPDQHLPYVKYVEQIKDIEFLRGD